MGKERMKESRKYEGEKDPPKKERILKARPVICTLENIKCVTS